MFSLQHVLSAPQRLYTTISPRQLASDQQIRHPANKKIAKVIDRWEKQRKQTLRTVERYVMLNQATLSQLPVIARDTEMIIFLPGTSPIQRGDKAGIPARWGIDPQSPLNKLSTVLLEGHYQRINDQSKHKKRAESILYFPTSPVLWPQRLNFDSTPIIAHAMPSIVHEQNAKLISKNKCVFGTLEKTLGMTTSDTNFIYTDTFFSTKKAKNQIVQSVADFVRTYNRMTESKIDEPQWTIDTSIMDYETTKQVFAHQQLESTTLILSMAALYAQVIKNLGIKKAEDVVVYCTKTSPTYHIMSLATKHLFGSEPLLIGGPSGPLSIKKQEIPRYDVLEPSAQGALFGYIKGVFDYRDKKSVRPSALPRKKRAKEQLPPFNSCHYLPPILCQMQEKCDNRSLPCTYTQAQRTIKEDTRNLLTKDARDNHASFYEGIEGIIRLLNTEERMISIDDKDGVFTRLIREVRPLPFDDKPYKNLPGNLRASLMNQTCGLASFISYRFGNIIKNTGLVIDEKLEELSKIGTTIHSLMLDQFMEQGVPVVTESNKILEKIGQKIHFRNEYCEKALYTKINMAKQDIVITGSADGVLLAIDRYGQENVMIFDAKRSTANNKKGYYYQTSLYAQAVEEILNIGSSRHFLVLMNRQRIPSHKKIPLTHTQTYHRPKITVKAIIPKNDSLIRERNIFALNRVKEFSSFERDYLYAKTYKGIMEQKRKCETCLSQQRFVCDEILGKGKHQKRNYLLEITT